MSVFCLVVLVVAVVLVDFVVVVVVDMAFGSRLVEFNIGLFIVCCWSQ